MGDIEKRIFEAVITMIKTNCRYNKFKIICKFYDDIYKDIIEKLIHFEDITIDIVGSCIWLSGNTRPHKDDIKAIGFLWSSKHKKWFFNGDNKKRRIRNKKTYEEIKDEYGCTTYKSSGSMKIS